MTEKDRIKFIIGGLVGIIIGVVLVTCIFAEEKHGMLPRDKARIMNGEVWGWVGPIGEKGDKKYICREGTFLLADDKAKVWHKGVYCLPFGENSKVLPSP